MQPWTWLFPSWTLHNGRKELVIQYWIKINEYLGSTIQNQLIRHRNLLWPCHCPFCIALNTFPHITMFSICKQRKTKNFCEFFSILYILKVILISIIGQRAEVRLHFCQHLKEQYHYSWRMMSLVDVILRYSKEDQVEARQKIDEGRYSGFHL